MKCSEIMEILERLAPRKYALGWDNPGLNAGRSDKEVKKVLITVDIDEAAIKEALKTDVDMIISHHPLIFDPIKQVNDRDLIGRRLLTLIKSDISCFAMHTNYDIAPGCMADIAAEILKIADGEPLEVTGEDAGIPYGIGKVGRIMADVDELDLSLMVKKYFNLSSITVFGPELLKNHPLTRVAVCPGSGKGMTGAAIKKGAQALITGDIGHHEGHDAAAQGLLVIDAGHYGIEYIFVDAVKEYLDKQLSGQVETAAMGFKTPFVRI